MLVPFSDLLVEQERSGSAMGGFSCYDLEVASGVLAAACRADVGVILLISRDAFLASAGDELLAGVRAAAERSPARACVQLDHVSDVELMGRAFELGAGAVMADGSRFEFNDNVQLVQDARRCAREFAGAVEAELGHVAGDEDVARAADAGGFTDPGEAERFAAETEADCLAVSVGNVHGAYRGKARLDWKRLGAIEAKVSVPLSLHGASGLAEADVRRAVGAGIRKVNVNAELREAYVRVTARTIAAAEDGWQVMALHASQRSAIEQLVGRKIDSLAKVTA